MGAPWPSPSKKGTHAPDPGPPPHLKAHRSRNEVNWEKTMALALGSRSSILWISSRSASILVLDWNLEVSNRDRMLCFRNRVAGGGGAAAATSTPPSSAAVKSTVKGLEHTGQLNVTAAASVSKRGADVWLWGARGEVRRRRRRSSPCSRPARRHEQRSLPPHGGRIGHAILAHR